MTIGMRFVYLVCLIIAFLASPMAFSNSSANEKPKDPESVKVEDFEKEHGYHRC